LTADGRPKARPPQILAALQSGKVLTVWLIQATSGLDQRKLYYPLHNCRGSVSR
jgi:hypothetical protein